MSDTIVMIHGMWGGPGYWAHFRRFFEPLGYRCEAVTLPFHDGSPTQPPDPRLGTASVRDYADAVQRLIDTLDAPPILMGHSMGGLIAQMLAARVPTRAVVLLAPASPAGITALTPSVLRSFLPQMVRWAFWKRPMRQSFETAVYSMLHLLPPDEQRATYERFVFESGRAACEIGLWPLDRRHATRVDETAVQAPMLVIAGSEDRITPSTVVRKTAAKYGNRASFREFAAHAHWLMAEPGWEDIAAFVEQWLQPLRTAASRPPMGPVELRPCAESRS